MSIRFGIIGAGHVGVGTARGDSFIRSLETVPEARVAAICDVSRENADRAAAMADAQAFTDLEPFLESGLDAVIVCTPIRFHAEQAAAALARGIHVLSEVPAVNTLDAARQLADAAEASSAHYMLAENYRYLDEVELVKRMVDDGCFGELYYGEGAYIHDCRELWRDAGGAPTWRGQTGTGIGLGVYCTHSLGPLLYFFEDRVTQVAALANETSRVAPGRGGMFNYKMLMRTARGATLEVRVDTVSPRPHAASYYALQGSKGSYEGERGLGDEAKVWLESEHEPSRCGESAWWHHLMGYAERYIPERLAVGEEARAGGHGTTEYWMLKDFLAAVERDGTPAIDVYRALDYTVPGICAIESVAQSGAAVPVPDFRTEGA